MKIINWPLNLWENKLHDNIKLHFKDAILYEEDRYKILEKIYFIHTFPNIPCFLCLRFSNWYGASPFIFLNWFDRWNFQVRIFAKNRIINSKWFICRYIAKTAQAKVQTKALSKNLQSQRTRRNCFKNFPALWKKNQTHEPKQKT